jgi:hypothetical protein
VHEDLWIAAGEDRNDNHQGSCKDWNSREHVHSLSLAVVWLAQVLIEIVKKDKQQASWVDKLNADAEVGLKWKHPP